MSCRAWESWHARWKTLNKRAPLAASSAWSFAQTVTCPPTECRSRWKRLVVAFARSWSRRAGTRKQWHGSRPHLPSTTISCSNYRMRQPSSKTSGGSCSSPRTTLGPWRRTPVRFERTRQLAPWTATTSLRTNRSSSGQFCSATARLVTRSSATRGTRLPTRRPRSLSIGRTQRPGCASAPSFSSWKKLSSALHALKRRLRLCRVLLTLRIRSFGDSGSSSHRRSKYCSNSGQTSSQRFNPSESNSRPRLGPPAEPRRRRPKAPWHE
mmetsp:Transcript_9609/g.24344  ORF Transcript_9609/g.24344 Transcript_9609/m.24344 type:complete len:267 (-) Transcript_9609:144-944(-)